MDNLSSSIQLLIFNEWKQINGKTKKERKKEKRREERERERMGYCQK